MRYLNILKKIETLKLSILRSMKKIYNFDLKLFCFAKMSTDMIFRYFATMNSLITEDRISNSTRSCKYMNCFDFHFYYKYFLSLLTQSNVRDFPWKQMLIHFLIFF